MRMNINMSGSLSYAVHYGVKIERFHLQYFIYLQLKTYKERIKIVLMK